MRRAEPFASVAAVTSRRPTSAFDLRNINGQNFITPYATRAVRFLRRLWNLRKRSKANSAFNATTEPAVDLSEAHLFFCHGRAQGVTCAPMDARPSLCLCRQSWHRRLKPATPTT